LVETHLNVCGYLWEDAQYDPDVGSFISVCGYCVFGGNLNTNNVRGIRKRVKRKAWTTIQILRVGGNSTRTAAKSRLILLKAITMGSSRVGFLSRMELLKGESARPSGLMERRAGLKLGGTRALLECGQGPYHSG